MHRATNVVPAPSLFFFSVTPWQWPSAPRRRHRVVLASRCYCCHRAVSRLHPVFPPCRASCRALCVVSCAVVVAAVMSCVAVSCAVVVVVMPWHWPSASRRCRVVSPCRALCHQCRACTITFFFFCNTMAVAIGTTPSSPCRATAGHHRSGHGVDGVTPWYWPRASHCRCRCHRCMVVATSLSSPSLSCAGGHVAVVAVAVMCWWPRLWCHRVVVALATRISPPSLRGGGSVAAAAVLSQSLHAGCHSAAVVFAIAVWW